MIVCKFCGNENPDELQYCEICGKELKNALLNSLVGFGADGNLNTNGNYTSTRGGVPQKGFEDTGGGAASGPRRNASVKADEGSTGGSAGTVVATIVAIVIIALVAAYFLIYANNAPFAHLKELLPF